MESYSFNDELDKITNSSSNLLSRQVKDYLLTGEYQAYASTIYPIDRAVYIYTLHYKTLVSCFQTIKSQGFYNDDGFLQQDTILMDALAQLHGYLSTVFSLVEILKKQSDKDPARHELLNEYNQFMDLEMTKFFLVLRDNILHQVNFSTLLQFHSGRNEPKLVYLVDELLKADHWQKSKDFIFNFGETVTIEDLIPTFHNHVFAFFDRFEALIFNSNIFAYNNVLVTLHNFAKQYDEIGEKGFLPVSKEYLAKKLKFLPEGFS